MKVARTISTGMPANGRTKRIIKQASSGYYTYMERIRQQAARISDPSLVGPVASRIDPHHFIRFQGLLEQKRILSSIITDCDQLLLKDLKENFKPEFLNISHLKRKS